MLVEEIPESPELVKGLFREGCKAVIGGPSKARKTWLLMDFAISVAGVSALSPAIERVKSAKTEAKAKIVSDSKPTLASLLLTGCEE